MTGYSKYYNFRVTYRTTLVTELRVREDLDPLTSEIGHLALLSGAGTGGELIAEDGGEVSIRRVVPAGTYTIAATGNARSFYDWSLTAQ